MSIRVRIDFSVSFFYKVFYKSNNRKYLDLEMLFTLCVFLLFIRLSLFGVL